MSDISHSDYCPVNNTGELEDCAHCTADYERQKNYYGALYAREKHYSSEEIVDAYSDPSERNKRDILLERLSQ